LNEGTVKKSIIDFVVQVTTQGTADFVPPAERIPGRVKHTPVSIMCAAHADEICVPDNFDEAFPKLRRRSRKQESTAKRGVPSVGRVWDARPRGLCEKPFYRKQRATS
jgi:hypothetical protein